MSNNSLLFLINIEISHSLCQEESILLNKKSLGRIRLNNNSRKISANQIHLNNKYLPNKQEIKIN